MQGTTTTVLIADDDVDSRAIARAILEYQGLKVVEATDGPGCLDAVRRCHPDLVVLDLVMPRLDGWQVAEALRADPPSRHIPIIALTAAATSSDRDRALRSGCNRVLLKPISPLDLAAEIDALIRRPLPGAGDASGLRAAG